jgi:hypothetical protein
MSPACLGEFGAARVPHSPPGGSGGAKGRGCGLGAQAEEEPLTLVPPRPLVPRATPDTGRGGRERVFKQWGGSQLRWGRRWWTAKGRPVGRRRKGRGGVNRTGRDGRRESGCRCWYLWGGKRGGGKAQRQQQQVVRVEDLFRPRLTRPPAPWPWLTALLFRLSVDAVRPCPWPLKQRERKNRFHR